MSKWDKYFDSDTYKNQLSKIFYNNISVKTDYSFLYDTPICQTVNTLHVRYRHTPNGECYYKQERFPNNQCIFKNIRLQDYPFKWIKSNLLRMKAIYIGREIIIQIGMVALFMLLVYYCVTF